jgi:hypothetical protein
LLKILEPFAQEEEMTLDEVTKGDLDMEYATVKFYFRWLVTVEIFYTQKQGRVVGNERGRGSSRIAEFNELVRLSTG